MALPRTGLVMPAGTPGEAGRALEEVLATAQEGERRGFDALLLDGRRPAGGGPWRSFDPFTVLGACAATTSELRLGALVSIDERPASLVAKAVATLDVCSGGRAVLVLATAEPGRAARKAGAAPPGDGSSAEWLGDLAEALAIVAAMLVEPAATVTGQHLAVRDAWNEPRRAIRPPLAVALDRPSADVLAGIVGWASPPDLVLLEGPVPPGAVGPGSGAGPGGSGGSGLPVLVRRAASPGADPAHLPAPTPGVLTALGAPGVSRLPGRRSGPATPS